LAPAAALVNGMWLLAYAAMPQTGVAGGRTRNHREVTSGFG
jgi:hypothetical protein